MERRYIAFDTGRGCLAGLTAAVVLFAIAVVVVTWTDLPGWAEFVTIAAAGVPLLWFAFAIDRRAKRNANAESEGKDVDV